MRESPENPETELRERSPNPIRKSSPLTAGERLVAELCENTFLSLWSYPSVFNNRDANRKGEGQQICDLLVVFDNHVLVFSHKQCEFPDTGNLDVDWGRWFKRAVLRSANQVWGAERWLQEHPDRVFLDSTCQQPFPVTLPLPPDARYHLIVVTHGSAERGKRELGGNGGLVVTNTLRGALLRQKPFTIGDIDPSQSFVHVFDEVALPVALSALDTVTDFVSYLEARRDLLRGETHVLARSEADLIAIYLTHVSADGVRHFPDMAAGEGMFIDEGQWEELLRSTAWEHERELDEISYAWDHMLESFAGHTLNDTRQFSYPHDDFSDSETILRFLAREPRYRRRVLAQAWLESLTKSVDGTRYTRWVVPSHNDEVYWVFVFLARSEHVTYERYREMRALTLEAACVATKLKYPSALDIIGIASESGLNHVGRSEDAMYLNGRLWTDADQQRAMTLQSTLDVMRDIRPVAVPVATYNVKPSGLIELLKRSVAEGPCPCGSGRAYQNCHAGAT